MILYENILRNKKDLQNAVIDFHILFWSLFQMRQ